MLKIRYNIMTTQLSGWVDKEEEFDLLEVREGEATEVLDIEKPDVDDYEFFVCKDNKLVPSGKTLPRDLSAEIDAIKVRVKKLERK